MKVSINWIRKGNSLYGSAGELAVDGNQALVERIGAQLAGVDETIAIGNWYRGVVVVRIISSVDHPNANRLHICLIDDGGTVEGVERDSNGHVQVVCGAPNVREGMLAVWLPPGATVPNTFIKDPFVLEARPLRGVVSNGMMASPKELALGDSHEGILEIDTDVMPGTLFADAFDLTDDLVIDMENKMFTHRPDCFGQVGIAREIEGIHGRPYVSPDWYQLNPYLPAIEAEELPLEVENRLPELVPRFTAVVLRDVTVKPSPVWLQVALSRIGIRPINNIVDYTNFFMMETGQPLHAYDYDKLAALDDAKTAKIVIRHPEKGEKIRLLNGKEIEPRAEAIMIASRDKLIGVGGVMGGADTEVDQTTSNIVIEVANFDMYSIRRTAMAHGLFTDAVTRFNKGQSPLQALAVIAKITDEIRTHANGKLASPFIDDNHVAHEVMARGSLHAPVVVSGQFINARLGLSLDVSQMAGILRNVECTVDLQDDVMTVTAPFWRADIALPEDVVEEVGRLYGYDKLPLELPVRSILPTKKNARLELRQTIRSQLATFGANEVLTYSFVHGDLLQKTGQDKQLAFQLSNALSPSLQYYRMNLIPSLLDKVHLNIKAGYDEFALFEMGKGHSLLHKDDDEGLPKELEMLALVYAASDKVQKAGAAFYQAKLFLTSLATALGIELTFSPVESLPDRSVANYYEANRTALVTIKGTDLFLGTIGEFKASVRRNLKLPVQSAGFELDLQQLLGAPKTLSSYTVLPRFPKIEQDLCLRVPFSVTYDDVVHFAQEQLKQHQPTHTTVSLAPVDIYMRPDDPGHKQITLRYSLANHDRTLTDDEVNSLLDTIAQAADEALQAQRV